MGKVSSIEQNRKVQSRNSDCRSS